MKTAVEKAKELVDKHRTYLRMADKYDYLDSEDEIYLATQCALVTVDEILNENSKRGGEEDEIVEYEPFWYEVKNELLTFKQQEQ